MDKNLSCNDRQRKPDPVVHRRMQLLEFEGFEKLTNVMETAVPLHGKCNFPTLEVTPRELVQRVRSRLVEENIKVRDIRLNGSAATHVLSHYSAHSYQDLDLIFAVDLSDYSEDECEDILPMKRSHGRYTTRNSTESKWADHAGFCRQRSVNENTMAPPPPLLTRKTTQSPPLWLAKNLATDMDGSMLCDRPAKLSLNDCVDNFLPITTPLENGKISPVSDVDGSGPKSVLDDEPDDVTDSGYTSSGSSVSSYPVSPSSHWSLKTTLRTRTHSLESSSSITSSSSCGLSRKSGRISSKTIDGRRLRFSSARSNKEQCWKKIKDVVIKILTELLPSEMRGNADAVSDAYVQKMVKVTSDEDSWSLFSLNNNEGKNLELKFVETMQRQYEFSVDSFQIILDSYIDFKMVIRDSDVGLSSDFYPTILAESVYGDFQGALRHLHHKRICTKRPEKIRGGGLLRYCNLLVRDFTPGEVPWYEEDTDMSPDLLHEEDLIPTYGTSDSKDVEHLEQLMCSRFFIDFNDFRRQQNKLSSYLESHFVNEDDLKFNYLLILRRVVNANTICLMMHERTTIINYITDLAKQALLKNIGNMGVKEGPYQPSLPAVYYPSKQTMPHGSFQHVPPSQHCTVNQNYGSNTTVYTYVEPVTSASEQQAQYPSGNQEQYRPCCVGTCHQCGAKQVYPQQQQQQQVDGNNNVVYRESNANYNSNNNNNLTEHVPTPGYMYTQPMYNQNPDVTYIYPSPASEETQNFMLNCDAPVFPIVYCGESTQCFYSYDKEVVE